MLPYKAILLASFSFFLIQHEALAQVDCGQIDLSTFSSCYDVNVSTISDDLSGVCYNYETQTLYVAINGNESIRELDLDGNELRNINLVGFWDTEAIAYLGNHEFAVTEEQNGRIVILSIPEGTSDTTINYPGVASYIQMSGAFGGNQGLEGLAYNYINDSMYMVKEKNDIDLFGIENPKSLVGTTQASNMVFDLDALAQNYPAVSGQSFSDAAGLSFTPYGSLLILSEEGNSLVEVDANDGSELSHLLIPDMTQPEGVIAISATEIILVGELNELYFYSTDCSTPLLDSDNDGVPDTSDNCPDQSNADQVDVDMNGEGDHCQGTYSCTRVMGDNTNTWIGPMIAYWYDDPCYWSKGIFPTPCDDVVIDLENTRVNIQSGSTVYGYSLHVSESATLDVDNNAVMCIVPWPE